MARYGPLRIRACLRRSAVNTMPAPMTMRASVVRRSHPGWTSSRDRLGDVGNDVRLSWTGRWRRYRRVRGNRRGAWNGGRENTLNAGRTVGLFGMVAAVNYSENSRTIVHPGAVITGNRRLTVPDPNAANGLVRPRAENEGKIPRARDLSRYRRPTSAAFAVGASSRGRGS